jgi:hypothetical protein
MLIHKFYASVLGNFRVLCVRTSACDPYEKEDLPVTNAFCSCPLKPVAQGLTVTTLLLLKRKKPTAEIKASIEPAITPAMRTV